MNTNQAKCDPALIELFLRQQLSDEEQTAFESHLDGCLDCRRRLEATAAGADVWSGVRDSLRGQQMPPDCPQSAPPAHDSATDGDASFSHGMVLRLLAPTDDDRMIGRLGTYEVVGVIGSGGMGVVLKAFDAALNRYVAIKVLAPHLGSSGAARKRFSREAQAAAAVVHDNVIEIHGVADADGLPYLVMPYVRGPSLQRRLDVEGPLGLVEVLRIGMQAASGLAAAHAQGLVHRDVKPANILLADGVERVKLTDFGLARAADDASLTKTGIIAGTPQYMSPEQARGELVGQRSDLFSLGSVMYAMCTGRAPFRAETSYGILRRITDEEPRPIRDINPDIPEWLCRIIAWLMSKEPNERFESARVATELLGECLAHVQQPASVPLPTICFSLTERGPTSFGLAERTAATSQGFPGFKLLAGAFAFMMIAATVMIVLGLGQGKQTIESTATRQEPGIPGQRDAVAVAPSDGPASGYRDFLWGALRSLQHQQGRLLLGIAGEEQRLIALRQPVEIPADATSETKALRQREEQLRAAKSADISNRVQALRADLELIEPQIVFVKIKLDELPAAGATVQMALDARVVAVSDGEVEISVGKNEGVLAGMRLAVFRDRVRQGDIEIVKVDSDKSAARILHEDPQSPLRRGDRAMMLLDSDMSEIVGRDVGESIYNDRLKRYKFRLERIDVTSVVETAEQFWNQYRHRGNPPISGVWGDPRTNSLIIVGPPEAEQPIRNTIAEWEGATLGIDVQESDSLEIQNRQFQNRRTSLLEQIAHRRFEIIDAQSRKNPDIDQLKELDRTLAAETAELEIVERKLKVISDSIEGSPGSASKVGNSTDKVQGTRHSPTSPR